MICCINNYLSSEHIASSPAEFGWPTIEPFGREITPIVLKENLIWTFSGGTSSCLIGTA